MPPVRSYPEDPEIQLDAETGEEEEEGAPVEVTILEPEDEDGPLIEIVESKPASGAGRRTVTSNDSMTETL